MAAEQKRICTIFNSEAPPSCSSLHEFYNKSHSCYTNPNPLPTDRRDRVWEPKLRACPNCTNAQVKKSRDIASKKRKIDDDKEQKEEDQILEALREELASKSKQLEQSNAEIATLKANLATLKAKLASKFQHNSSKATLK